MEKKTPVRSKTTETKIGNTVYIVTTHFKEDARENAEQKMLRLVSERVSAELKSPENLANKGAIQSL